MTTFSQLVDSVVVELVRPDQRGNIASYLNQTLRELHFRPGHNSPILYEENRREDDPAINTDGVWLWPVPNPATFHDVEAIFLPELGIYVPRKNPRITRNQSFEPYADVFYYRGGSTIAISGVKNGWTAQISYHVFPRSLAYQLPASRIVEYNPETGEYERKNGGTPSQAEMDAATNWLLQRWDTVIAEGLRAKAWKRIGDEGRARMCFSAFESMRTSITNGEPSS